MLSKVKVMSFRFNAKVVYTVMYICNLNTNIENII